MRAVISALTVTALAFSLIFVLDKVADARLVVFHTKHIFWYPKNHGISKLVGTGDPSHPCKKTHPHGPVILRVQK